MAQHALDDRIDSLQRLIARLPDDTAKAHAYTLLVNSYYNRCALHSATHADSVAFLQVAKACRSFSKKLNYTYGVGYSFLAESYFYYYLQKLPESSERLQQAIAVFRASNDKAHLALAYNVKAAMVTGENALAKKISLYDTSAKLAHEGGDFISEGRALKEIADIHLSEGKYKIAIKELYKILDLQKEKGDKAIFYTTDLLTHAFMNTGNHKEALKNAIATLDLCYKSNDTSLIVTFYQRLGDIYFSMRNYEKSYYYYNRALSARNTEIWHTDQNKDQATMMILIKMAKCLMQQQKYKEALLFLLSLIHI